MKISCPSCSAKYSIADEKVQARLAKIRCRKCGATIVIDGKVSPPTVTATAADGDASVGEAQDTHGASEYSVDFGEGDQRTLSLPDIVSAYNAGQITGETFLWADGFPDWKPLSEIPEIVQALHAASAPAAAPAPAASTSSPFTAPSPAPFAARPQPSPARAAARPQRSATADLFGGIDSAGSEDEVATSAPEPAFGGASAATGSRNESSVLFSLSALTSAATAAKPSSPSRASASTATSREDSGLIDLKALTAAAVKADTAVAAPAVGIAPIAASPLGVAPLGLGSPLGGGLAGIEAPPPQKSRAVLYLAIAIVLAAAIVAVAFVLRPPPPAPVVAVPDPAPIPTPAPTPTPTPTLAAAPPATSTAEEEEEEKAGTSKKNVRTTRRTTTASTKKASTSSGSGAAAEKPAAPAPKSSNCGCSPTDLMCNMRCKSKK